MKKFKKLICLVLAISMILGCAPVYAFSLFNKGSNYQLNYRDVDFKPALLERSDENPNKGATEDPLPSAYRSDSLGRLGNIKDQFSGTCWAFAATAVAEASLATNEHKTPKDLSELQLVYFFYHDKVDPLNNCGGDKTECLDSDGILAVGGNNTFTIWSLAGWTNGAPEIINGNNGTLSSSNAYSRTGITDNYAYEYDIAHLQNAKIIDSTDREGIKRAIMKYGAVSTSYHESSSYYNRSTGGYYCSSSNKTNHAVAIVGWDDNFSSEDFNSKPSGNGAWLIRNSWGTSGSDGRPNGYFWMSYYDKSWNGNNGNYVFDFEPRDNYEFNYQYDGSCGNSFVSVPTNGYAAAIYTASGSDYEEIDAVGIGVASTSERGTAYIYKNLTNADNPLSGTIVAEQSFTTDYQGYYTVKLDTPVKVARGETFSVVFKFKGDASIFIDKSYENGDWIRFTADTSGDKTYFIESNGKTITNLGNNANKKTARIKAYTNSCAAEAVTYQIIYDANVSSGTVSYLPAPQNKTTGSRTTLSSQIPTLEGYSFLGWSKSQDAVVPDYKPGDALKDDLTIDENGKAYLYAVWAQEQGEVSVILKSFLFIIKIIRIQTSQGYHDVYYKYNDAWTKGSIFLKLFNVQPFYIMATDGNGYVHYYKYTPASSITQEVNATDIR